MDFKAIREMFREAIAPLMDADSQDNFDPRVIETLPIIDAIGRIYFRSEVRGIEKVPEGPALIVGNHNAGITFLEPFVMAARWYLVKGGKDPLHFIAHDAMVSIPFLSNLLIKGGAVRGGWNNARKVLESGHKLVVYPGGNHEAFRKFTDRNKIDFGGHKGFAKLAVEKNVPIVPVVNVGGHETFFVLTPGQKLAKLLGTDKLLRSKTFAISLALPWGLMLGPLFFFPLPAKFEVEFGEPIYPSECLDKEKTPEQKADDLYDLVTGRMQKMLDRVSSRRLLPVIGL